MKKIMTAIAIAALSAGCVSQKANSEQQRYSVSWAAFCNARGYDINDNTYEATNEYFDTWCGSAEEEKAFITAGLKPL